MRRGLGVIGLALLGATAPAIAEEPALETRLYPVHALVAAAPGFVPELLGAVPDAEATPAFGGEEHGSRPVFGTIDEVIQLVKEGVEGWASTPGAELRALGSRILAHVPPAGHEAVARFLAGLEADALTSVTTEVVALPDDGSAVEGREEALAASAPGPRVVLTSLAGRRATAYAGREIAYLRDQDVASSEKARFADPVVGVLQVGFVVDVRGTPAGPTGNVRLELGIAVADEGVASPGSARERGGIEAPGAVGTTVRSARTVPAGRWVRWPGGPSSGGGWTFLVRATLLRPEESVARRRAWPAFAPAAEGTLVTRLHDVADLAVVPSAVSEEPVHLLPSHHDDPEESFHDPAPLLGADQVVVLLQDALPVWSREGVFVQERDDRLQVRHDAESQRAVALSLAHLRRELLWSVETRAEVLTIPEAAARGLGDLARAGVLPDDAARARLVAAAGASVERLHATGLGGERTLTRSGRRVAYVADYRAVVFEKGGGAEPVSTEVLSGTVLDVTCAPTSAEDAVAATVRITRSRVEEPIRRVDTVHGPIDAPRLGMTTMRTTLRVPLGRTAVVGAGTWKGRTTLLLVTHRLVRPE